MCVNGNGGKRAKCYNNGLVNSSTSSIDPSNKKVNCSPPPNKPMIHTPAHIQNNTIAIALCMPALNGIARTGEQLFALMRFVIGGGGWFDGTLKNDTIVFWLILPHKLFFSGGRQFQSNLGNFVNFSSKFFSFPRHPSNLSRRERCVHNLWKSAIKQQQSAHVKSHEIGHGHFATTGRMNLWICQHEKHAQAKETLCEDFFRAAI